MWNVVIMQCSQLFLFFFCVCVCVYILLNRIDTARAQRHLLQYPKRIILVRHAESQGNVNKHLYANVPDSQLKITEKGQRQAHVRKE